MLPTFYFEILFSMLGYHNELLLAFPDSSTRKGTSWNVEHALHGK